MRILVVSTADWDHPFWTNKQHVTMALASLGHDVLYVESLGIRSFSMNGVHDSQRVLRRLRRFIRPPRRISPQIHIASPLVFPLWSKKTVVALNRILLRLQMWSWRFSWGRWDAIWTYSPITMAAVPVGSVPVLYHCVDNISAQPFMPTAAIDRYETELVRRSNLIFSTAPDLTDRLRQMGASKIIEHTNVVDFEHFGGGYQERASDSASSQKRRVIGFVGALSSYKVDLQLLKAVAEAFPEADVVLIGQIGEGQPGETLEELSGLANVKILGPKPYEELPQMISTFDVALLPVPINEYTRSMFPMKFFEYLACGVPVVSTEIPSLLKFGSFAFISHSREQFLADVEAALTVPGSWREDGRALASNYTYRKRTEDMLHALQPVVSSRDWSMLDEA